MFSPVPRPVVRLGLALAVLLAAAAPAGADLFTVTLSNGTTIESRYQPQEASWDSGMVLLMTEVGNWIGVRKDDIADVSSEMVRRGFGIPINTTTVLLGTAPNDAAVAPGADEKGGANDPVLRALQAIQAQQQQQQERQNYTIQQFVEPEETQGIPANLISPYAGPPPPRQ
jgi:hypothetical protein